MQVQFGNTRPTVRTGAVLDRHPFVNSKPYQLLEQNADGSYCGVPVDTPVKKFVPTRDNRGAWSQDGLLYDVIG